MIIDNLTLTALILFVAISAFLLGSKNSARRIKQSNDGKKITRD